LPLPVATSVASGMRATISLAQVASRPGVTVAKITVPPTV
jgi:hypothetical protein